MPVVNDSRHIHCPQCRARNVPIGGAHLDGTYLATCPSCDHQFKFKAIPTPRMSVSFTINGMQYEVKNSLDINMKLNEYIREVAGLKGTKVMCREGGCGCCVVMVTRQNPLLGKEESVAINSCLCPLYSCDGWKITTTEGIGNKTQGFHQVQEKLAEHNGSQCGYCSPGMVMNMYSYLQEHPHPTKQDVDDAFDGNICRCTGYRAILDSMQEFVPTADIEDLGRKHCHGNCSGGSCQRACAKPDPVHMVFSTAQWYKPVDLPGLYQILQQYQQQKYSLVVGGTGIGGDNVALIDTKEIADLYTVQLQSDPITIGANVTLSDLAGLLDEASLRSGYSYCTELAKHLRKVANRPVRNVGCWAGNLVWKHGDPGFPSDVFTVMETVGATVVLSSSSGTQHEMSLEQFLTFDLDQQVILKLKLRPLSSQHIVKTYKVMPRTQNALAYVNAGFRMKIDQTAGYKVLEQPSVVFGGISPDFVHASKTEGFLMGKNLLNNQVLQEALHILSDEIKPSSEPSEASATYRKNLALSLFYKFVLNVCGDALPDRLKSGGTILERPLSSGTETYDTDHSKWPLTQPMPKLAAKLQTSGEAQYVNDIPAFPGELYAAFVVTTVGNAQIQNVDPSSALGMPGVVKYLSAADIPAGGVNNSQPPPNGPEELFCSGQVLYAGQAVGLIIADSQLHADAAAQAVKVTYTNVQPPVLDLRKAVEKKAFFPGTSTNLVKGNAEEAIAKSPKVVTGEVLLADQYHFQLETQSCVCIPTEDGMDVYPTTQWVDLSQQSISMVLGVPNNSLNIQVKRLGGAYGSKITRNFQIGAACALAAHVMKRPVRLMLSLATNMQMVGGRWPYLAKYQVGVGMDGKLNGVKVEYFGDGGCSPNDAALAVMNICGDNAYYCDNWHFSGIAVKTNKPCTTSARAPGFLPAIFIMEQMIEQVANELNLDPIGVRMRNLYQQGQFTPSGQQLTHCNLQLVMSDLLKSADVSQRQQAVTEFNQANRWKKKALSVLPVKFGIEWGFAQFLVHMSVYNGDGTVSIAHGGIECGQGISTKVIQVCAYELGIPISMVTVKSSNALTNANSMTTGGSITSELCCLGVIECCKMLKERMAPVKAKMKDPTWLQLVQKSFQQGVNLTTEYWTNEKTPSPAAYFAYGAACTESELDVLTGENQINRVDILYDCGQSMNPEIDIGQIHGAFIMGLGYFLTEKMRYDPVTGQNVSSTTWVYKPPMSKDIPVDFRVKLLKNAPNPSGVLSSKAVGEPPLCLSSSVFFAVKQAIQAARQDIGRDEYFEMDTPATVEAAQTMCLVNPSQFVIH